MGDLIDNEEYAILGSVNEADLILSRGEGSFDINYNDEAIIDEIRGRKICKKHLDELSRNWHRGTYNHFYYKKGAHTNKKVCSYPDALEKHSPQRPLNKIKLEINKDEARAVLKQTKILLHIGLRK
jgi:hypothetical protein